jgi:hypothetical protein
VIATYSGGGIYGDIVTDWTVTLFGDYSIPVLRRFIQFDPLLTGRLVVLLSDVVGGVVFQVFSTVVVRC